jgi:hypothetical protein
MFFQNVGLLSQAVQCYIPGDKTVQDVYWFLILNVFQNLDVWNGL